MAMKMPQSVAQQSFFPDVNRSSLVFFGGLVLIVLNFYWANGGAAIASVFHPGTQARFEGLDHTAFQIVGLALLTLAAEYFGDNAGTAALLFIGVLWLLWLLTHFGTQPEQGSGASEKTPAQSNSPISDSGSSGSLGGSGGQKK